MKLRIIVEVVDEKSRKGTRRRREVEVPARTLNIHKALCESRMDLRAFIAEDVMSGVLASILGQQTNQDTLSEALLSEPSRAPVRVEASGGLRQVARAPASHNKVESFLGLDVIEHMDGLERSVHRVEEAARPAPVPGQAAEQEFEWGSIGYGPDRGR